MFFLILLLIILNPYVSLCMQYNDHNLFIHIPGYLMIGKVPLYYSIMEVLKDSTINGIYPVGTFHYVKLYIKVKLISLENLLKTIKKI